MSGTAAFIVGLVIAISDGDTLTVLSDDRQQVKVRLAEIDAPEKQQAFGTRSQQSSASFVTRSTLRFASSTSIDMAEPLRA